VGTAAAYHEASGIWIKDATKLPTEEERERYREAYAHGSVCCRCGVALPPLSPVGMLGAKLVHYYPFRRDYEVVRTIATGCMTCFKKLKAAYAVSIKKCPSCSRLIHLAGYSEYNRTFFCSKRCRNRFHKATFLARHPRVKKERQLRPCVVCGTEFMAKRADAKACSPTCRQRQRRQRQREAVTDR
jgi:hypothetical protein